MDGKILTCCCCWLLILLLLILLLLLYCLSLSLSVVTAIFPREPGLACFMEAKDDGNSSDNWSYKTCKAPVKLSPPINQHPVFLQAGCPSCRPTNSVNALKGNYYTSWLVPLDAVLLLRLCPRKSQAVYSAHKFNKSKRTIMTAGRQHCKKLCKN